MFIWAENLRERLKLVSTTFYQIFIFHQMMALQKLWKMLFVSSKKLFSSFGYSSFCIFVLPSFFLCQPCLRGWSKKNLKINDVMNCLYKNLTYFLWYLMKQVRCDIETLSIDRELNKELFNGEIMQEMCTKSYPQTPF